MNTVSCAAFVAFALLVSCPSVVALAQSSEASAETDIESAHHHFDVAMEHYNAGRFEEAAAEFQIAYDLSHRPELLHNIYLSRRDMGDIQGAVEALRRYLTEATIAPADRETLLHRLRGMESSLTHAPADGASDTSADVSTSDPDSASSASAEAPPPGDPSTAQDAGSGMSDLAPVGWVLAASAAAPAILAIVGGMMMQGERDALYDQCSAGPSMTGCPAGVDVDGAVSRFETDRALLWTGVGIGAAVLVTGLALGIIGTVASQPPAVQPSAMCSPTGCAASVRVRF